MATDQDYIFDAIDIFKSSITGQGKADYGDGGPSFIKRYQTLAAKAIATLTRLSASTFLTPSKITFVPMEADEWGDSDPPNGPIHIPLRIKSPRYLPVIASILAHEATHYNTEPEVGPNYVPDELACRTLECLFYQDLTTTGVSINSLVHGTRMSPVRMHFKLAHADWLGGMRNQYDHFQKKQLIDFVLSMETYRNHLMADWVEKNLEYWGGPKNRWSTTLGYYVHRLAAHPSTTRNRLVQKLMMIASDRGRDAWVKMIKAAAVSTVAAAQIRSALSVSEIFMSSRDNVTMKSRVLKWGLASQPDNGLNCLP